MIKACLFDIGNVLVDFDFRRTFDGLLHRTPRSMEEIRQRISGMIPELETGRMGSDAFASDLMEFIGGDLTHPEFLTAYNAIFQAIPQMWEVMEKVRARVPVYLFSNTSELHETHLLQTFPDFARFHGGFYSWRLGYMKPDPGMYEAALTTLNLPAHEIAYIDDLLPNIETGRRLGFHCHQYDMARHDELVKFLTNLGLLTD